MLLTIAVRGRRHAPRPDVPNGCCEENDHATIGHDAGIRPELAKKDHRRTNDPDGQGPEAARLIMSGFKKASSEEFVGNWHDSNTGWKVSAAPGEGDAGPWSLAFSFRS